MERRKKTKSGRPRTLQELGLQENVARKLAAHGIRSLQQLANATAEAILRVPGLGHRALKQCRHVLEEHAQELRTPETLGQVAREVVAARDAVHSAKRNERGDWEADCAYLRAEYNHLYKERAVMLNEQRGLKDEVRQLQDDVGRLKAERSGLLVQLSRVERAIGEYDLLKRSAASLHRADEILSQATVSRSELKLAEILRVLGSEQSVLAAMRLSADWLNEPPFAIGPLMTVPRGWWHRRRNEPAPPPGKYETLLQDSRAGWPS